MLHGTRPCHRCVQATSSAKDRLKKLLTAKDKKVCVWMRRVGRGRGQGVGQGSKRRETHMATHGA